MVNLFQPAVFPEIGTEGFGTELAFHELLDFDEA
jgi:hypothetical protein